MKPKTCSKGHPINTRNSYINKRGNRICRVCVREHARQQYARNYRALNPGEHVVYPDATS